MRVQPQTGLRQGDLISSYLYTLCAEGLIDIIRNYEEISLIYGCRVARGAPRISHLLFADDCYVFFKATQTEARNMKNILNKYALLSGKIVNYISQILFSALIHV